MRGLEKERGLDENRLRSAFIVSDMSPATVNFDLSIVKMLFRAARRDGYTLENAAEFVEPVREDGNNFRRPFTIPEIRRILDSADDEWKSLILFGAKLSKHPAMQ